MDPVPQRYAGPGYYAPPLAGGAGGIVTPPRRRAGIGPWPQGIPGILGTIFRLYGQNFVKLTLLSLVVTGIPSVLPGAFGVLALYLTGFDVTESFLQNLLPGGGLWHTLGLDSLQRYDPSSGQPYVPPVPKFPLASLSPDQWLILAIAAAAGLMLYFALVAWQMGTLAVAARECTLGRPLRIGLAMREGLRRLFPVLGTVLLIGLMIFALVILWATAYFGVLTFAFGPVLSRQFGGLQQFSGSAAVLMLLLIMILYCSFYVAYIYLLVSTGMAPYIAGADALSPLRSVRRSWSLVWGNWWRTFTPLLVIGLALGVGSYIAYSPGEFAPIFVYLAIVVPVVTALEMPLWSLAFIVMYYDLRLRREGYLPLAGELNLPTDFPPPPAWPYGTATPPPTGPAQAGQSPAG